MLAPLMHALDQLNLDKWRPFDFLTKLGEEGKERAKWALKRGGEVAWHHVVALEPS